MSRFKIKTLEKIKVRAGWRDWLFLKVELDSGLVGWSEFTDSNGSIPTLMCAINDIENTIRGIEFDGVMPIVTALRRKYRQSLPGIMWKAISALENALWDLESQVQQRQINNFFSENPVCEEKELFKAYWSHCPTTRIRSSKYIEAEPIINLIDLIKLGEEIKLRGFSAIKTNLISLLPNPHVHMPGFNKNFSIYQEGLPINYEDELSKIIDLLTSQNNDLEVIIDLNFNVNPFEYIKIQKSLYKKNIRWIEVDFDDWDTGQIYLQNTHFPICTGENIIGLWNFMPILMDKRIHIISIDLLWNGLTESVKIAREAIKHGKKIAVHNYYGALATSMAVTFLSLLPRESLELVEFDFDDVPWRDLIVTNPILIEEGFLQSNPGIGWNNSLNLTNAKDFIH